MEYMGFRIAKDVIIPADSMTASIRNFPQPRNISDARAFFGLVEPISFAFSKCAIAGSSSLDLTLHGAGLCHNPVSPPNG